MTSKYAIQLILQASTELYIHAWLHNKRRDHTWVNYWVGP